MHPWRLVGRSAELAELEAAYTLVANGQGPRVAVLTAESGVGKTRLLVELYGRLVRAHEGDDYWPEHLPANDVSLPLNPEPAQFNWPEDRTASAPFIWWGLRCTDPQRRNSAWVDGGAINSAAIALLPHLYFLEHVRVANGVKRDLADLTLDGAIEVAGLLTDAVPGFGLFKSLVVNRWKRWQQAKELRQLQAARSSVQAASDLRAARLDEQLLEGMKALLKPSGSSTSGLKGVPVVICIDDAHWLDPISAGFVGRLLEAARQANWPLLLIFTAWPEPWHAALTQPSAPQWQVLSTTLLAMQDAKRADQRSLDPSDGVDQIIRDVYPGLHVEQRRTIADKVGSDLYRLRELLRSLSENDRRFVDRDPRKELSAAGLDWLGKLQRGRSDIVRDRFEQLPPGVREFIGLWSLMGPDLPEALGLDVIGSLAASGWPDITGNTAKQLLESAVRTHFLLARTTPNVLGFADDAMADAAAERILASPEDVAKVRQEARLFVARWMASGTFESLGWPELPVFLKVAAWAVGPEPVDSITDRSMQRQIASSIVTMQQIIGMAVPRELLVQASSGSGTDVLETTAFRARLPTRWQAKWLMRHAADLGFRARESTLTFLDLRDAAIETLSEAVDALLIEPNWDQVEAASLSAAAGVAMAWSAINQFPDSDDWEEKLAKPATDAMPPVSEALESVIGRLSQNDALTRTLRICLLVQRAEAERERADEFVLPVVDDLIALVDGQQFSNQAAQLVLDGPLAQVLLAWPGYGPSRDHAARVANAVVNAFDGAALSSLGSFQLASLALCVPRATAWRGTLADRYELVMNINLELIHRGMGAVVLGWTWTGQEAVMLESGHVREDGARLSFQDLNVDTTWTSVTRQLQRICAEEVQLREVDLIDLCISCLRPLARLLLALDTPSLSNLSAYVRRVSALSYSARTQLTIAAAKAWMHESQSAIDQLGYQRAPNSDNLTANLLSATLLYPPEYQSAFKDWGRGHKVAELVGKAMHDRVPGLDRLRLLTSCLVPLADCIDLFPEADRSEVLMWALMVLRFTTIDWEEQRGDQLQPLFTDLMKAHESLKSAVRWHADHVQVMRQIVEKYSATAGSVDGSYGSGRAN
jgi:hypothetical protein